MRISIVTPLSFGSLPIHQMKFYPIFFTSRVRAARLAGPIVALRVSVCASVTVWEGLGRS